MNSMDMKRREKRGEGSREQTKRKKGRAEGGEKNTSRAKQNCVGRSHRPASRTQESDQLCVLLGLGKERGRVEGLVCETELQNENRASAVEGGKVGRGGGGGESRGIQGGEANKEEEVRAKFAKKSGGDGREKPTGEAGSIDTSGKAIMGASIENEQRVGQRAPHKGTMDEQEGAVVAGDVEGAKAGMGTAAKDVAGSVREAGAQRARARGAGGGEGGVGKVAGGGPG